MGRAWLLILFAGCSQRNLTFSCELDAQCGVDGICEGNGLCSFADGECASGRRFGEQQGELSNTCVGDGPTPDAQDCPDDLDCDLVLDGDDNCPRIANEDQANEDSDPRGDACDLCPPFDDNGEDDDGDGVGNSCDPHPDSADTLVEFAGFRALPAGWTMMDGTITVGNGVAILAAPANQSARLMRATPPGTRYTIWAEAELDTIAAGPLGAVGLAVRHAPDTDDIGGLCQLVGSATGMTQELRLFNTGDGGAVLLDSTPHPFTPGAVFELYLEHDDGFLSCDASEPDASIESPTTFDPTSPEIGLRVRSATARYRWVMVLSTN